MLVRPGQVKPLLLLSLVANVALAGGVAFLMLQPKGGDSSNPRAGTGEGSDKEVNALGRIQPAAGLISVFAIPGDQLSLLSVKVGDTVSTGQKLGELSGAKGRALSLVTLQKQIDEAEKLRKAIGASRDAKLLDIDAEAKQATAGFDQDALALDAKVKAVLLQKKRYDNDLARARMVNASPQEIEQLEAASATADAERVAAEALKAKMVAQKNQSAESIAAKKASLNAETERGLAQVPYESLKAGLALAERKTKDGELLAPTAGRVVRIMVKPGDTVTTMPLIQIADTKSMTVIAEVYETDVGRIRAWLKTGPVKVEATARALGKDLILNGTVANPDKIAPLIAKNALTPLGPREDADRRVVEVEVELDNAATDAAQNFIGLQVTAKFKAK